MKVKGVVAKSLSIFVQERFKERYEEWFNSLPKESQEIMKSTSSAQWYNLEFAVIKPTEKICELFYNGDMERGGRDAGRFSAEYAARGIYKILIKIKSPKYVINKTAFIFGTYYDEGSVSVEKKSDKEFIMYIRNIDNMPKLLEYRIAGYIEKIIELTGAKNVKVSIVKSLSKGDDYTEMVLTWN